MTTKTKTNPVKYLETLDRSTRLETLVGPIYGYRGIGPCPEVRRVRVSPLWKFWDRKYGDVDILHACSFCGRESPGREMWLYVDGYGGVAAFEGVKEPRRCPFHPQCLRNGQNLEVAKHILEIVVGWMEEEKKTRKRVEELGNG